MAIRQWNRTGSIALIIAANILQGGASMGTVLLVILVLLLIGALPTWPYSGGWGYYPSGGVGLLLLIIIILLVSGRI